MTFVAAFLLAATALSPTDQAAIDAYAAGEPDQAPAVRALMPDERLENLRQALAAFEASHQTAQEPAALPTTARIADPDTVETTPLPSPFPTLTGAPKGALQQTLEFREPSNLTSKAGPAAKDRPLDAIAWLALAVGCVVLLTIAMYLEDWAAKYGPKVRRRLSRLPSTMHHCASANTAALICAGLGIVAADTLLLRGLTWDAPIYVPHKEGWISFVGAGIAIAGLYFRLRSPPKI